MLRRKNLSSEKVDLCTQSDVSTMGGGDWEAYDAALIISEFHEDRRINLSSEKVDSTAFLAAVACIISCWIQENFRNKEERKKGIRRESSTVFVGCFAVSNESYRVIGVICAHYCCI